MPKSFNAQDARIIVDGKPIETVGHDFGFDRPPRPKKRIALGGPATGLPLKAKSLAHKPPKRKLTEREKQAKAVNAAQGAGYPMNTKKKRVAFA